MIINMKIEDSKYLDIVMWLFKEYVEFDEKAITKNSEEGDYLYFTGLEYDSYDNSLVVRANSYKPLAKQEIILKLDELTKLGIISDVIIDGDQAVFYFS